MKKNAPPSFHPHEPARAGLARIARGLVDDALARIEPAGEQIHQIRVAIKRLRALLLLIRPAVSERFFEREKSRLRKAAQALAPARDAAMVRKTMRKLADSADGRRERRAFARVLRGFRRIPADSANLEQALRAVGAALRLHAAAIRRWRLRGEDWDLIGPGLEAVYRAGRRRMKRALARSGDEDFHRWRIRAKGLFYQLEMLAPLWPGRLCKTLARLKKLERRLGDDHDLTVLKATLEEAPDDFGGVCVVRRVITCLGRRSRKLRTASEKLGAAIYREKPCVFREQIERQWQAWRTPP